MGIMFIGNNLMIEYNHIRHMNLETEDTGAVYTGGRDWLGSRGSAHVGRWCATITSMTSLASVRMNTDAGSRRTSPGACSGTGSTRRAGSTTLASASP